MKVKASQNVWGNWNCYEGTKMVYQSSQQYDAIDWLSERLAKGDCQLSEKSGINMDEVNAHRADLERSKYY